MCAPVSGRRSVSAADAPPGSVALLLIGTFVLFFLRDYFRRAVEVVTQETGKSLLTSLSYFF